MTQPDPAVPDRDAPAASTTAARDHAWIARIREGDAAAFEALFLAYTPRLCDFVFRYVHAREEAEEIVQDLFVWLWQHRATLPIRGAVSTYLYAAARHRALDRLKRERVRERWRSGEASNPAAEPKGADVALELAERQAAIERAIAELPERRRAVCVLRWVDGLSYAEIAQRLGVSEKTVDSQLQNAIRFIRQALAGF